MPKMIEAHEHDPELWMHVLQALVSEARATNSDLRFGQLLYLAISMHDKQYPEYDGSFHSRLFNIQDGELETILQEFHEWAESQRKKA